MRIIYKQSVNTILLVILILLQSCNNSHGLFDFEGDIVSLSNVPQPADSITNLTDEQINDAIKFAEENIFRMKRLESTISRSRINITKESISFGQLLESLPNDLSKENDRIAQIILRASIQMLNRHCISNGYKAGQCTAGLSKLSLPDSDILDKCEELVNNQHTYRRLLPANYRDGLYRIPSDLALPKHISDILFQSNANNMNVDGGMVNNLNHQEGLLDSNKHNIALVQWAQFIEHDLVKTVVQTMGNNVPIECCSKDYSDAPPRYIHPACAPLKVQSNRVSCLNYVRSALGINKDCKFGPAEQLNQATSNLDLSQLYGITNAETNSLRRFKNGELKSNGDRLYPTLPQAQESEHLCMINTNETNNICYKSGDSRVNIDPYVTILYTMFLRSHNRLAKEIKKTNKSWKDYQIFNMARKINIAIYRKIIYKEWLPIILGESMADEINNLNNNNNIIDNSENINKFRISNEFATVGIRFYYSMMPGDLIINRDYSEMQSRESNFITLTSPVREIVEMKNEFYKPRNLSMNNELEIIMDAILTQTAMAMDIGYVDDIARYRFQYSELQNIGTDVLALDILRGRDHGLAPYVKYLKLCTNIHINDWNDLLLIMDDKNIDRLKLVYTNVNKIDLIIGAISEIPKVGATVGPTFACILGEQFYNIKYAAVAAVTAQSATATSYIDDNDDGNILSIISDYTSAEFICDTTKLPTIPSNIFYVPSERNGIISCDDLNSIRLL